MLRLIVVSLLVVACAGCARIAAPTAPGNRHPWTIPHVLRFADISEPDHLNPYLSEMDITYDLSSLMYSYLIVADDRGRLIGDLATTVPTLANGGISRDGRTYTYHLRHGVRWQDGVPFTSHDVVASWRAVVNPRNLTIYRQGYDRISSIDTPDDWTVIVHLRDRYPPFVTQFFAPLQEGGKPILPAHILARERSFNRGELSRHPIGTGPFRFVSWHHGDRIELTRFNRYFRGRPKLQRIEFRVIPDDQTILTEMRLHHIDLVVSPPAPLYEAYRSLHDVVTQPVPWNAQEVLVINGRRPGLGDIAVRRAMANAIDYRVLIDKFSHGVGETAYNVFAPTAIGYERLAPYRYDPTQAERLLTRAGWVRGRDGIRTKGKTRLDFTVDVITGSVNLNEIALNLQQDFRAVGIGLSIKGYPYDTIFSAGGPLYSGKYDMAIYSTTLSWDPDAHVYYGCDQWYPHGENFFGYCNRQFDTYEREGLATDDAHLRAQAYRQASRILHDTVAYIPLYELRRIVVRSPDLHGLRDNPTSTPWWNAWQWDI
ncbi:MAG: ABC transporter substrate-binding protein [Vulcanimicrobiaceae bacterium]